MKKIIFTLISLSILFTPSYVLAANNKSTSGFLEVEKQTDAFVKSSHLNTEVTLAGTVSTLLGIFLGFLGMIFLVFTVYAGFLWMTAQGSEDQINKAKGILKNSIIGLIIVVASYAITYFVFNTLNSSGLGSGSTGIGETGGGGS